MKDKALQHTLVFGIGVHHAGLAERDRNTVEELFVSGKIQILVSTSTLAWGVNFPAHLVVIKVSTVGTKAGLKCVREGRKRGMSWIGQFSRLGCRASVSFVGMADVTIPS